MKKLVGGVVLFLVLVSALLLILYHQYVKKYDIRDFSVGSDTYYEIVYSEDKQNYYYLTEERFSELGASVFNSKYIVYPIFKEKTFRKGYNQYLRNLKQFDLNIYDMFTQKKVNIIDAKGYLDDYSKEWQLWGPNIVSIYRDGRYYARFTLEKRPQKISKDETKNVYDESRSLLYIDIENGASFFESDGSVVVDWIRKPSKIWLKFETFLEKNGCEKTDIRYFPSQNQLVQISLPVSSLPSENKKLYELFPQLQEIDRTSGLYVRIYLNNQEDDLGLIELLLPDGQEEKFDEISERIVTMEAQEKYDELARLYIEYKKSRKSIY